jgi:cytochrome c
MRIIRHVIVALLLCFCLTGAAIAQTAGTPEEAKAMALKAAALLRSDGFDKAAAEFNQKTDGPFHDRDLYVYIWNTDGKCLVNPGTPALVGKTFIDLKDVDGKPIIRNVIAVKDEGWVDYNWSNPVTHKVQLKRTYIVAVGDMRVGVGAYQ